MFEKRWSWRFHEKKKNTFCTIFLSAPKAPPPQKEKTLLLLSSRRLWLILLCWRKKKGKTTKQDLRWPRAGSFQIGLFSAWPFAIFTRKRSFAPFCVFLLPTAFRTTAFGNCRLTVESPRPGAHFQWNDSDSGPKVRVTGRKSELRAKSQSYSRADPQNLNRIEQKRALNGV